MEEGGARFGTVRLQRQDSCLHGAVDTGRPVGRTANIPKLLRQ